MPDIHLSGQHISKGENWFAKNTAQKIKTRVPTRIGARSIDFYIFINDLFLINLASESLADDNTLYSCGHDLQDIVTNLGTDLSKLLAWFNSNGMVAN